MFLFKKQAGAEQLGSDLARLVQRMTSHELSWEQYVAELSKISATFMAALMVLRFKIDDVDKFVDQIEALPPTPRFMAYSSLLEAIGYGDWDHNPLVNYALMCLGQPLHRLALGESMQKREEGRLLEALYFARQMQVAAEAAAKDAPHLSATASLELGYVLRAMGFEALPRGLSRTCSRPGECSSSRR